VGIKSENESTNPVNKRKHFYAETEMKNNSLTKNRLPEYLLNRVDIT
jgi:hypothetical protein